MARIHLPHTTMAWQDLRERAGACLVPSLREGWGSLDTPILKCVSGFNTSEGSGALQKEELRSNPLRVVELMVLCTSLG